MKNIGKRKKMLALHFRVNENLLEVELLENDHVPAQDFLKHKCDLFRF